MMKIKERAIDRVAVKSAIEKPFRKENDKIYSDIVHFISEKDGKYLRVLGRFEDSETFLVVSAFYDRRLKRKETKHA